MRIGSLNLRWSRDSNSVRSPIPSSDPLHTYNAWSSRHGSSSMRGESQMPSTHLPCALPSLTGDNLSRSFLSSNSSTSTFDLANVDADSASVHIGLNRQPLLDEPRHIVQSSPSVIHQPRPTRGARLSLFEMKSPEPDDRSTTAQVGFARYPARAKRDDIRWSSWLKTESDMLLRRPAEVDEQERPPRSITPETSQPRVISPNHTLSQSAVPHARGCSTSSTRAYSPTLLPQNSASVITVLSSSSESSDAVTPEPQALKYPPIVDGNGVRRIDTATCMSGQGTDARPCNSTRDLLPTSTTLPQAVNVQDLLELLIASEGQPVQHEEVLTAPQETSEDEDEIWKRFVFDDSPEEINRKA